jgi:hypothetical protein
MDRPRNSPLRALRRSAGQQQARRDRDRGVGRVAEALRRRDEEAETDGRSWRGSLRSGIAPYPWRSKVAQREAGKPKTSERD